MPAVGGVAVGGVGREMMLLSGRPWWLARWRMGVPANIKKEKSLNVPLKTVSLRPTINHKGRLDVLLGGACDCLPYDFDALN